MKAAPLVSVLTPSYNHERFIAGCIASVRAQTYTNWEHIIVDDGSSDETWRIVQQHAGTDSRIRAFRQPHRGPEQMAQTYNSGLAAARGDWIAILEGDDYWFPDKLEIQMAVCTPRTVLCYAAYLDDMSGELRAGPRPPFEGTMPLHEFIPHVLLHRSFMLAVTQVVRKGALVAVGGFRQDGSPAAVDFATLLCLIRLPGDVVFVPEPLGVWRHHETQSTNVLAVEIAKFNSDLALRFYDSLSTKARHETGLSREDIVRARRAQIADAYFAVLRQKLRHREKEGIPALIAGTWRYGRMKRKAQAIYARAAVRLGFDLEPLLRFADRFSPVPKDTKQVGATARGDLDRRETG